MGDMEDTEGEDHNLVEFLAHAANSDVAKLVAEVERLQDVINKLDKLGFIDYSHLYMFDEFDMDWVCRFCAKWAAKQEQIEHTADCPGLGALKVVERREGE